jgi:uncharacterized radical SAM superfamily protein
MLTCKHCEGKLLQTMTSAPTPKELWRICKNIKEYKANGCLISGGCMFDGSIPFQKFLSTIHKVKKELDLKITMHTGIINEDHVSDLVDTGIDAISLDIIGSDETIKDIYRLKANTENFERSLKALNDSGIKISPHILIGLHYGKLKGEFNAVDMVSRYNISSVIFIIFTPFKGTQMEHIQPPHPLEIKKVFSYAKEKMPTTFQTLGCIRPLHQHRIETDMIAIKTGINGLVYPTSQAIKFAQTHNYHIETRYTCCALSYM